ncbi:MAG: 2-alkenal reductase [Candidatus Marinimicrobia bacterium]|nr:2-alkenal reductase [Candidatus Neomarinimicrobiota bacterium]|tara:strand:- start:36027 stop:37151 length:1125 start_codon:yes stop_codon:yes gene_type:complete
MIYKLLLLLLLLVNILLSDKKSEVNQKISFDRNNAITDAVALVSPSVVGINVTQLKKQSIDPFFDPFFDSFFKRHHQRTYKIKNLGSGVIISNDGYIVTNSHVVENASEIIVSCVDGKTYEAIIIGIDELTDIALIKVESENDFPYVNLGDSDNLIVGEWVIALGNPLGLFDISNQPTATVGIVSGIGLDFGQKESGKVYQNMLQTDASINSGNSGGPLVNVFGDVIGINTFIMTNSNYNEGSIGIGFAIPINSVKLIVSELKKYGKIERDFITGLHVQRIDRNMQRILKIEGQTGLIITDIDKDSSGEKSGLMIGDVILTVNGKNIGSVSDVIKVINEGLHRVGDFVNLGILRKEKNIDIELELMSKKEGVFY